MVIFNFCQGLLRRALFFTADRAHLARATMSSTYSLSPTNPHKRPRHSLSPSRHHAYYPSFPSQQPSLANLANDRLASRNKLQSTWEDIIQKYSGIADEEADEIDLETGEVIVDHGHLKSLHDSSLWDPLDSETDDTDDPSSEHGGPDELLQYYPSHQQEQASEVEEQSTLPSEEEIIKQFGEEYGRDIVHYLQHRNSSTNTKGGKAQLWLGLKDEEMIFSRAKELWKQYRMRPSPVKQGRFDKDSFEKAVFGSAVFSKSSFEQAVFGYVKERNWSDEEPEEQKEQEREVLKLPVGSFDEIVFGRQHGDQVSEEEVVEGEEKGLPAGNFEDVIFGDVRKEERPHQEDEGDKASVKFDVVGRARVNQLPSEDYQAKINLSGSLTTYAIDGQIPTTPQNNYKRQRSVSTVRESPITLIHTPQRIHTPSKQPLLSTTKKRRRTTTEKKRRNVVSGLIVDATDEEDDFFSSIPSSGQSVILKREGARRSVPNTPLVSGKRNRSLSSSSSRGGRIMGHGNDTELIITEVEDVKTNGLTTITTDTTEFSMRTEDIKGICGDIGYRCSKPFCFKCT